MLTKSPSTFPSQDPAETFQPKCLRHHQAQVHSKISKQSTLSCPELRPIHNPSTIPSHALSSMLLPFHTKRTSIHTPKLPPILISHSSSFRSPHPDSVSHMGYTRPSLRPHGSHCTCIPGWIPNPGPVLDASPGYSCEFSHAQGLRRDSYPPNTCILLSS